MSQYHKDALPPGHELDEYVIESVLGHGGFGITYRARDRHLETRVAIKEYFPGELAVRKDIAQVIPKATPKAPRDYLLGLRNFIKEARALARFKHPNIVRVLRYLEANGTAYMVMEYEQGESLADHLRREGPTTLTETALHHIFLPILNGVQAVHDADMLHLDIKPENIYLRRDGSPMLIDFGSTRQAISQTMPDKFLVTHGYAPIEQYPDRGKQGPWTDIYALGASMYRCISGKRPVNALERYQAILNYRLDPLAPAVAAGKDHYSPLLLECIDWALQIHPRDRPQSVREFQDRLLRGPGTTTRTAASTTATTTTSTTRSAGWSMGPRPLPPIRASRQSSRRHRWVLPLMLLAAVVAGYAWFGYRPFMPAPETPAEHRPATVPDAPTAGGTTMPPEAAGASATDASDTARPSPERPSSTPYQTLAGHAEGVFAVAFSANGGRLAVGAGDGKVHVWDSMRGTSLKVLEGHGRAVSVVAFSRDGRWLASASLDGSVRLWDARALRPHAEWSNFGGSLRALAFSPDGKRLAAAGRANRVSIWDIDGKQPRLTLAGHSDEIYAVVFSPDGQWLASAGADRTVRLWNSTRAGNAVNLSVHRAEVRSLAFSPDGRWLAAGTMDNVIRLIETGAGTQVRTLTPARAPVLALAYMPDGKRLVAGTGDHRVLLVDPESGELLRFFDAGTEAVTSVTVSPDGRFIAAGNRDGRARIWQFR